MWGVCGWRRGESKAPHFHKFDGIGHCAYRMLAYLRKQEKPGRLAFQAASTISSLFSFLLEFMFKLQKLDLNAV